MSNHSVRQLSSQAGQAAILAVVIILPVSLVILFSISLIAFTNLKIIRDVENSVQSYYVAESGIEDSVLRLMDADLSYQTSNSLSLNGGTTTITITQTGQRVEVISQGNKANLVRKLSTKLLKTTTEAQFFYGVQVGDGGLEIRHADGEVVGNVFSNGTAFGKGSITGTMVVANNGNEITDLTIGEDAEVYSCTDATIGGDLTYNAAGSSNCTVAGSTTTQTDEIAPRDFPISEATLDDWKADAAAGGTLVGDQTIGDDQTLGPVKIDGNLYIDNGVTLTLTGTVWVTGTYDNGNVGVVQLDEDTYGDLSGVMIVDGNVEVGNNVILRGTSSPQSYLLMVGTSPSLDESDAAMDVRNNIDGAILYATDGLMIIHNNAGVVEATAYQLLIRKATVTYELGLDNLEFSSGPAGGWDILSWQEVE